MADPLLLVVAVMVFSGLAGPSKRTPSMGQQARAVLAGWGPEGLVC